MVESYEEWERQCQEIREENELILKDFEKWLTKKSLKPKTIRNHLQNVDFYINHFLLYDDAVRAEDGALIIYSFFTYFFPRKAMWASPSSVKSTAASFKKFYQFMFEQNRIDGETMQELKETIKECLPEWMEEAEY